MTTEGDTMHDPLNPDDLREQLNPKDQAEWDWWVQWHKRVTEGEGQP